MTLVFQQVAIAIALFFASITAFFVAQNATEIEIQGQSTSYNNTYVEENDSLLAVNATILELLNGHAYLKHGTEVNDAFKCLNDRGSTRSFKTFGFLDENNKYIPTNLWLCYDGVNWYAIVTTALEKSGGNRVGRLVTAYLVDKVKFSDIDMFITAIKNQWRAIEINFIIEAGSVFLQPK
jgi:hypothetical protein